MTPRPKETSKLDETMQFGTDKFSSDHTEITTLYNQEIQKFNISEQSQRTI